MRLFLTKTFVLLSISLLIFLTVIFGIPSVTRCRTRIPPQFIEKLNKSQIIIAGDSRADRQLDPAVLFQRTGLPTINIAASSAEVYPFSKCFKEAGISNKILVISASFFQFNDGAIDPGYFSVSSYADLSFAQKLSMYKYRIPGFLYMQEQLVQRWLPDGNALSDFGNFQRPINSGFDKQVYGSAKASDDWIQEHPWYKSPQTNGVRRQLLLEGLINLSMLKNCKVLIYNGPVSQDFYDAAGRSGALQLEKSFDAFMQRECGQRKIFYHSFLTDTLFRNAELYYDPQHLCGAGTIPFSMAVANLLYSTGILVKRL